jgi:hypothetical protein
MLPRPEFNFQGLTFRKIAAAKEAPNRRHAPSAANSASMRSADRLLHLLAFFIS